MKQEPTEDSVIKEHLFGHCQYASSDLDKHTCPGIFQRSFHGQVKKGRKKVDGIIYLDEYYKCICLCHVPEDERPKKRTRKKATTKTRRKK